MTKILITAAVCTLVLPVLAQAKVQCQAYPKVERMDARKLQQQLLNQGYLIREFDYERNCYEVKVVDKDGQRSKLYLDAKSGKVTESVIRSKDRKTRRDSERTQWW